MLAKETISNTEWHSLAIEEAMERLQSEEQGLSSEEANSRIERFGPNELEEVKDVNLAMLVLRQLKSPLIYLLAAAALVALLVGKSLDAGVILAVVILNTTLGVIQEYRAEKALEALREMAAPKAKVRRGGDEQTISAREVVPGDVLILRAGDTVAADARLLTTHELETDESTLTGESQAVAKATEKVEQKTPLAERSNMVFSSTSLTRGRAEALVVTTGMDTEVGTIAGEVRSAKRQQTPLQKRIGRLSIYIGILAVFLAGAVWVMGWLRGLDLTEMALYSIAVAVSSIPEGLPAVISITLAIGVRRMSERNAILRQLPAVETLGSTTIVCTDKTGTVTKNEMTVVRMWAGGEFFEVSGEGYEPKGEIKRAENAKEDGKKENKDHREALDMLLCIGVLNNDSRILHKDEKSSVEGTPTEGALLVVGMKAELEPDELTEKHPRIDEIPFASEHKYMATLHEFPERGRLLLVKGAPERIISSSSHIMLEGTRKQIDEQMRERLEQVNDELASQGLRVVAGAWREADDASKAVAESDLTFAGMWGIMDPPRKEAVEAIANAKRASMRIILMTGDNASTAAAIAAQAGISAEDGESLTGSQLDDMNEEDLTQALQKTDVFARVSPSHKLRILEALLDQGEIVAMTGDGVNDAPALKGASIGVAMGQAGTEVAREAADMILTDDNFATIIAAVEEGRVIFSNLRRVVYYLLTTNLGEVLTFFTALAIGLPLPLTAIMIIWTNLITDGVCDIALGVEPKHGNVLDQPPRPPQKGIVDKVMVRRIALLAPIMAAGTLGNFWLNLDQGQAYAQTIAFTTLAAFQWFQALSARSRHQSLFRIGLFSNRWLLLAITVAVVLQILTIYLPWAHGIFGTVALSFLDWGVCMLFASSILVADEILKLFKVHHSRTERDFKSSQA